MINNPCEWGSATLLIFSENVGTLVYYTHMFPLLISLFLGIVVLVNNPRALVNRVLFFVTLMFSIWVYFDLILWASPTPEAVMFFWSAIVPIEMLMYLGALYLVYLFSTDKTDAPTWLKVIFGLTMLPIVLFAHTNLNVVGLAPDCDLGAVEGPLIQYMYLVELLLIGVMAFFVYRGYTHLSDEASRRKNLYIGIATILFTLFFSAGNLTLLFEMGPFYEQYKLFGMPIFAAFVTYTIVKYSAFSVKTLLTEIFVAVLWILLFSIMLFEEMANARPIIAVTLVVFAVLGLQLVRSVRREVHQREEIERLAKNLERANKRLKELDRMKSEFVSIASHQLRSPLTSIRGYASMLLDGSYGTLSEKAHEVVHHIAESSRFMALSVADYLNVSRIEAGNMKYEQEDFNLKETASKIVDDLRREAIQKGLVLKLKTDLTSTGIVNADPGKTRQILHNLIDNAMKYTESGTITVTVREKKRPKQIIVDVTDTGIGMSQETLEDVFGKFERAHNANRVNVTGTGLGLFVARKMAQGMGGDVTATSPGEGKGSTFTFTLPLKM